MRDYIVPPLPETIWQNPIHFIAFGFGSGALPIAPGTFGTLMAIPFYLLMRPLPIYAYLTVIFAVTLASIWICDKTSKDIRISDHQGMCLDEFVGFFFTMIAAPTGWIWLVIGFILFRLFDIWKPWPIRSVDERIHGGFGMILDDVLAGLMACGLIQIMFIIVR